MDHLRSPVERLTFDMFKAASDLINEQKREEQNVVLGAFSAAASAALIYTGSGGATADQLKRIMRFDRLFESRCTPQLIMIAFRQAIAHLTKRPDQRFPLDQQCRSSAFQMVMANKAFFRKGNTVQTEFYNNARHVFNTDIAEMKELKGGTDVEEIRKEINDWVYKNTNGEIPEMLPPLTLERTMESLTRMFLISVNFMRARWNEPFPSQQVSNGIFTNFRGQKLSTPMLRGLMHLAYSEDNEHHVKYVELPYANNEACFCILMPTSFRGHRRTLGDMLRTFKSDTFMHIAVKKKLRRVDFKMPRFKIDNTLDLKEIFARIGMKSAVEAGADYSNMVDDQGFHLTGAFLKCSIEVNENGSSAEYYAEKEYVPAADLAYRQSSIPDVVEFHADHPFLFCVRHNCSSLLLFVGRVCDLPGAPVAQSGGMEDSTSSRGRLSISHSNGVGSFFSRHRTGSLFQTRSDPR